MRLVFIDDSQQLTPPRQGLGPLLAMGGVIVPDEHVRALGDALAGIKRAAGVPDEEELKWKPPKGSYLAGADGEVVKKLRLDLLSAAESHHARSIVVVLDHGAAYINESGATVGGIVLKWLFERVTMHLRDHESRGLIVSDKPGGGSSQEGKWLHETLNLTNFGTEYVQPDGIALPILTAPSHHVPHLQLADLIVAATTAAVAGRESGLALKRSLLALAHRHSLGDINGAGLVLFPECYNLYYWALGATSWSKPSKLTRTSLPVTGFRYDTDDGLPLRP